MKASILRFGDVQASELFLVVEMKLEKSEGKLEENGYVLNELWV